MLSHAPLEPDKIIPRIERMKKVFKIFLFWMSFWKNFRRIKNKGAEKIQTIANEWESGIIEKIRRVGGAES